MSLNKYLFAVVGRRYNVSGVDYLCVDTGFRDIKLVKLYHGKLCKPTKKNTLILWNPQNTPSWYGMQDTGEIKEAVS